MREIGSEFWNITNSRFEKSFFLLGRTALIYIVKDAIVSYGIKSALLPSWCCHTMIQPFFDCGIKIRYYDVLYDSKKGFYMDLLEPIDDEAFYYFDYFGYGNFARLDRLQIRKKWKCIIRDDTHAWLSGKNDRDDELNPDYSYISFRKWLAVPGLSVAIKYKHSFQVRANKKQCETYNELRQIAFRLKSEFMDGKSFNKDEFLSLFVKAELCIEKDYENYAPTIESIEIMYNSDWQEIRASRRKNAKLLLNELSQLDSLNLIFDSISDEAVPLFVPVLLQDETKRDRLRSYLIKNEIYCPVHWPLSSFHASISDKSKDIYQRELSLVCDQRYTSDEMFYLCKVIKDFCEENEF